MTVELMQNTSDINVLDKNISVLSSITGSLKDNCSILEPSILIEGNLPTGCNYLHIPDFNRYYYITDVTSVRNNMFKISAKVDVLKTYSAQIRACSGIVARQQNNWNLYVDDGSFKVYQNETFKLVQFPSGFDTFEFVLAVAGG